LTMVLGQRWRVQGCVWVRAQAQHRGTSASTASQSSQWRRWWNFWEPHIKVQILWSVSQMNSTRTWCSVAVRLSHRICIEAGFWMHGSNGQSFLCRHCNDKVFTLLPWILLYEYTHFSVNYVPVW
jgi:hypothetical protein